MSYKTENGTLTSVGLIQKHFYKIKATTRVINNQFNPASVPSEFDFMGFIQPVSGNEINRLGKYGENIKARLYYLDDRIKFNHIIERNGQKYKIEYLTQPEGISGKLRHKEALLSEVN